jgi:hypothetical protein
MSKRACKRFNSKNSYNRQKTAVQVKYNTIKNDVIDGSCTVDIYGEAVCTCNGEWTGCDCSSK